MWVGGAALHYMTMALLTGRREPEMDDPDPTSLVLHEVRKAAAMLGRRRARFGLGALAVVAGAYLTYVDPWGWLEPHPGQYDGGARSDDLGRDIGLMWETAPLGGTPDPTHGPNPRSSTDRAVNAASRVFNTVELVGRSRAEAMALLGDPKTFSDSIYNFPFRPSPRGSPVYRFDTGAYGRQFNVSVGRSGTVTAVDRHWIH